MDRRLAFWRSVKFKKAAFLAVGAGVILFMAFGGQDWRTASRASSGLAPRPEEERKAVVQVYAARTFNWRGYFAVHTWIALKEKNAPSYTTYQVIGWYLGWKGTAVDIRQDIPDRFWYGAEPQLIEELRGEEAEKAIPQIKKLAATYPYGKTYNAWPGPNSNTFISYIVRNVPELTVELPPHGQPQHQQRSGGNVATAQRPPRPTPPRHYEPVREESNAGKICIIIGIAVLAVLLLSYIAGLAVYHSKFLPKTYVNGVNIGGMTAEEASDAVLNTAQDMGLTFIPKSGDPITFKGSSFGCTVTLPDNALTEPADESHALWFRKLFSKTEYTVKMQDSYSEDALVSLIAAYDWGNVPPTDAKVVQNEDGSFTIQPEDNGNMVDTQKLSDYTVAQMREGNNTIQMADSDCYKKAAVTAESLEPTLALYNKIGAVEITYDMTDREEIFDPVGTEKLDHATIMDWITTDGDDITVDTDKASAWVQEHIADKYDTLVTGYNFKFKATEDGEITLPIGSDGIYGWKTNVSATVEKLVDYIKAGEAVTIEPVYKVEGFRMNSNAGVTYTGNTYIEVDICHQHLWYYVNGELFLESDVVTGKESDPTRATPPGAYKVWSRESPRKLGTYAVQGYETWVNYWMPVTYTGIGLHDLNRSAYGGDIYINNGSHGCINLPLDVAKKIYDKVTINTPVMIVP